ncbi:hypothetical protein A8C75_00375 [Marinobacterium aestuarii]|uniref:HTH tetR-type domain-containing protein n=1 Tax=Marinobacterium aestuarii TaxID=1821621 RepID=A0A1A9EU12_9GAMM|nr:TetR family transcriptional regulator [Marinobacterium aestuarii]ANG61059.1 hypothetical protein A8C75_00375 [Marinobacterium aestuarii]
MARRTPQEAEQTRQALLMAALEVFSQRGAATATLKDVATHAGVTHGALYWHFKNRDALLEALFQRVSLPFDRHYLEQLQASRQQALNALEGYLLGLLREITGDAQAQQVYQLFYAGNDSCAGVAALAQQRQRALNQGVGHIHYFLKQARKQQLVGLKKSQLEPMAKSICCLLLGVVQSLLLAPELFSCREQGSLLVRSCLRGL